MDEDEEEYTDIDDQSDEEDSNSEPSEDNLSEDELQECYQKIKKSRENYYKNAKMQIFNFSKQNVRFNGLIFSTLFPKSERISP